MMTRESVAILQVRFKVMLIHTDEVDRCYKTHKEWYGHNAFTRTMDKSVEEMAELIQAIMKLENENSEHNITRVREEFADVLLCLEFLGRGLGIEWTHSHTAVSELARKLDESLSECIKGKANE